MTYGGGMMEELLVLARDPQAWAALATLVVMEVVLGIDNLIFISILTNKLPEEKRSSARRVGIGLAVFLRLGLLSGVAFIVQLTTPLFSLFGHGFSWRDLILIGGGLFLIMFCVFIIQITARFGFNKPLPWTDEAAVILYVWVILWAAAAIVPEREHVVFDLVWNSVGYRARQAMRIVGNLMIGGLSLVAIPASWDYVHFMAREGSPVLGVPFMWVYLPFVLLLIALVIRSAWAIWNAVRGIGLETELRL